MNKLLHVIAFLIFFTAGKAMGSETKLLPEGAAVYAGFGTAIARTADFLIIGAPTDSGNVRFAGAVYIYGRDGRKWRLTASDVSSTGGFGQCH